VDNNEVFRSVKPKRLSDSAVDQILELVRSGQLGSGAKLPAERELITRLGVSRTSLREAIRILETMGVLRVVPGRGTWVREDCMQPQIGELVSWIPTHEHDVMQLFELREVLEVRAAQLAAERINEEQLITMSRSIQRLREAIERRDNEAMLLADREFHEALGAASGNVLLADVLTSLGHMVTNTRQALLAIPGRPEAILREHQAVLEALLGRNGRAAGKAMLNHVTKAEHAARAAASAGQLLVEAPSKQ